jgi:hypothetical protein
MSEKLNHIKKNKISIFLVLFLSILFILYLLYNQKLNKFDTYFLTFVLIIQIITFILVFITYNEQLMYICHYLYCFLITIGILLTNKYALLYFIIVIIYNTYLINFSMCIFYKLHWANTHFQNISTKIFFPTLLVIYIIKYLYVSRFSFSIS